MQKRGVAVTVKQLKDILTGVRVVSLISLGILRHAYGVPARPDAGLLPTSVQGTRHWHVLFIYFFIFFYFILFFFRCNPIRSVTRCSFSFSFYNELFRLLFPRLLVSLPIYMPASPPRA